MFESESQHLVYIYPWLAGYIMEFPDGSTQRSFSATCTAPNGVWESELPVLCSEDPLYMANYTFTPVGVSVRCMVTLKNKMFLALGG